MALSGPQLSAKFRQRGKYHRLATGNHYMLLIESEHLLTDFGGRKVLAFGLPGREWRVAEPTSQIAATGPNEDAGSACEQAFALKASIDLADPDQAPLSHLLEGFHTSQITNR